jgi:hypothetical protein
MDPVIGKPARSASIRSAGLWLLALWLGLAPIRAETGPPLEYRVKAAFLLNFAKFVEWPTEESTPPESQLYICVIGDDPFRGVLDQLVQGELVGSKKVVIQRYTGPPQAKCDVAYISRPVKETGRLLAALGPRVLTVGEGEDFLREGGMIAFVIDNRRVRFDVNQSAARAGSVRLSSRLLSVARKVDQ